MKMKRYIVPMLTLLAVLASCTSPHAPNPMEGIDVTLSVQDNATILEDRTIFERFQAVLNGEAEFISAYSGEHRDITRLWEEVTIDQLPVIAKQFSMVDLDYDGIPELILWLAMSDGSNDYVGFTILRERDSEIFSYTLWARAFMELKQNGTFSFSGGASNYGFGTISFLDTEYVVDRISYCEDLSDGPASYIVHYEPATKQEFLAAFDLYDKDQDATWYDFTQVNIDAIPQLEATASIDTEKPITTESLQILDDKMELNLDIYKVVLDLYYQDLYEHQSNPEQWKANQYDTENGLINSIVNPYWSWENADDLLAKEGFAFLDLNEDGTDELVIGWAGNEFWNMDEGYVFAVYTIVDGEVTLAIEGWERSRYIIGEDGYFYHNASSSSVETTFTKCRFSLEHKDFLEPIGALYSRGTATGDYWWEYNTNPGDSGITDYAEKHEDLLITQDEAYEIGTAWIESGVAIDFTLFSQYIFSD